MHTIFYSLEKCYFFKYNRVTSGNLVTTYSFIIFIRNQKFSKNQKSQIVPKEFKNSIKMGKMNWKIFKSIYR